MSNVLKNEKQQQVLALGQLGWPLRHIEEATGVRRETASAYLKAAGIAVRPPGGWGRRPAKPAMEVSTDPGHLQPSPEPVPGDPVPRPGRSPTASACEPYRDFIEQELRKGRNAMAVWQDLVDDHGFAAGYASVKRFVRKVRGSVPPEVHPVIFTPPGEEAQVDYGTGPMVRDPKTGQYRRTRLFVLTLGYSRKSIRLLVWRSSSQTWAQLHEQAFRRLGAAPRVMVLDNLREGVLKPDIYDPTLNPLYRDLLAHYDVVALPCRVRDPNRKGKVESGVGHAQKTPLKGLRFETIEAAQAYLDRWEERWGDTRIHGRVKRQVAAMFAEELPHLKPLPLEPFRYYQHGQRTVHLDGCIEVEGAYYEAPSSLAGQVIPVQWDGSHVRILDPKSGQLVLEHRRQERGRFRLRDPERAHRMTPGVHQLLVRARRAGPQVGTLCEAIHRHEGVLAARRILGVLSLARKHGAAVTDDACAAALELGSPTYRFVRRYLERQRPLPLTLKQVDPLIRELAHYRDFVHQMTQGDPS